MSSAHDRGPAPRSVGGSALSVDVHGRPLLKVEVRAGEVDVGADVMLPPAAPESGVPTGAALGPDRSMTGISATTPVVHIDGDDAVMVGVGNHEATVREDVEAAGLIHRLAQRQGSRARRSPRSAGAS